MEKYLSDIAGIYNQYVSKTENLFQQYESQFTERYSTFEETLNSWDTELLQAYTEFMAKIKLFQSEAETEFNAWFDGIKDKLGEDAAGALQLEIEQLTAAVEELRQRAEESSAGINGTLESLNKRLTAVESGWGINYNHDAVLGLCYMGAAWLSQHYERTEETAVLGLAYIGNSYLANTF